MPAVPFLAMQISARDRSLRVAADADESQHLLAKSDTVEKREKKSKLALLRKPFCKKEKKIQTATASEQPQAKVNFTPTHWFWLSEPRLHILDNEQTSSFTPLCISWIEGGKFWHYMSADNVALYKNPCDIKLAAAQSAQQSLMLCLSSSTHKYMQNEDVLKMMVLLPMISRCRSILDWEGPSLIMLAKLAAVKLGLEYCCRTLQKIQKKWATMDSEDTKSPPKAEKSLVQNFVASCIEATLTTLQCCKRLQNHFSIPDSSLDSPRRIVFAAMIGTKDHMAAGTASAWASKDLVLPQTKTSKREKTRYQLKQEEEEAAFKPSAAAASISSTSGTYCIFAAAAVAAKGRPLSADIILSRNEAVSSSAGQKTRSVVEANATKQARVGLPVDPTRDSGFSNSSSRRWRRSFECGELIKAEY